MVERAKRRRRRRRRRGDEWRPQRRRYWSGKKPFRPATKKRNESLFVVNVVTVLAFGIIFVFVLVVMRRSNRKLY
jgi:hypothetical protein